MPFFTSSGAEIPRIIVGTERLGSALPDALFSSGERRQTERYLDELVDAGCIALDTAASYQRGGSERLLGHWLHARRNRDRLFLISKGAHPNPLTRPFRPCRLTPRDLSADLHDSLRRLQTPYLDLYLIHRDSPSVPLAPILEVLVRFKEQGKIGAFGVSNWGHERIAALDALARASGVPSLAASSPHFSLLDWLRTPWPGCVSIAGAAKEKERAYYKDHQLPVLAWSPLGRGFFSATAEAGQPDGVYGSADNAARRRRARMLAERHRCTAAQIALAYLFNQAFPVYAVVSSRSVQNLKLNLASAALRLSESELRWLERGESM